MASAILKLSIYEDVITDSEFEAKAAEVVRYISAF